MHRMHYAALLAALLLSACVVAPAGPDYVVAPALPLTVELGAEPYYYQSGFYYYYNNNRWSYSHERTGPWRDLPRDRYPRETRFRGHDGRGDRDRDRDRDRGRDYRDRD